MKKTSSGMFLRVVSQIRPTLQTSLLSVIRAMSHNFILKLCVIVFVVIAAISFFTFISFLYYILSFHCIPVVGFFDVCNCLN